MKNLLAKLRIKKQEPQQDTVSKFLDMNAREHKQFMKNVIHNATEQQKRTIQEAERKTISS